MRVIVVAALVAFAATLASAAAPPSCTDGVYQLIVDAAGASRYYECAAPNFVGYRDCPAGTVTGTTLGPVAPGATPCSAFAGTTPGAQPGLCNGQTGFVCKHDTVAHTAQFYWCAPPFFEGWQACPAGLYCETEGMHAQTPCTTSVRPPVFVDSLTVHVTTALPKYNRLDCPGGLSSLGPNFRYAALTMKVARQGFLGVVAQHDADGMVFVYSSFNPADPTTGLVACNDNFQGSIGVSRIETSIAAGTYTVVLTTNEANARVSSLLVVAGTAGASLVL